MLTKNKLNCLLISALAIYTITLIRPITSYMTTSDNINLQNPCVIKTTCKECIQTRNCSWCSDIDMNDAPRCFPQNTRNCTNPSNPQTFFEIFEDKPLSKPKSAAAAAGGAGSSGGYSADGSYSASSSSSSSSSSSHSSSSSYGSQYSAEESITQMRPQRIHLQLRQGTVFWVCLLYI